MGSKLNFYLRPILSAIFTLAVLGIGIFHAKHFYSQKHFLEAVRRGDVTEVRARIRDGYDVNSQYMGEKPALVFAAEAGKTDVARELIQAGARINGKGPGGTTPLHYAAYAGHAEVARLLIQGGADVKDAQLLPAAVRSGDVDTVEVLLQAGADANPAGGPSLIQVACSLRRLEMVQALQKAGARGECNTRTHIAPGIDEVGWKPFLLQWSQEVLALVRSGKEPTAMESEVLRSQYQGFPGATDREIAAAEARLGVTLPPSYKAFLKASNGWRQIAMDADDGKMFPVEQIDWFREKYPESIRNWTLSTPASILFPVPDDKYFVYGPEQDPVNMRNEYLKDALCISEQIDAAVYLLNPKVVTKDGEWEAWFFGYKLPGANRYRSFKEMMEAEYPRILDGLEDAIEYQKSQK